MGSLHQLLPRETLRGMRLLTAQQLVDERRSRLREELLSTGVEACDDMLGGGLRRGEMVEIVGGRSSGRFALVQSALAAVTERGEPAALIDLGDGFDPQSGEAAGIDLERLLWARPRKIKEAFASAEAILTLGMPLVVIDLGMPPLPGGRGAEAAWLRLARAAREKRTALVVASPYRASGTAVRTVLELKRSWGTVLRNEYQRPVLLKDLKTEIRVGKARGQQDQEDKKMERAVWQNPEMPIPTNIPEVSLQATA